MSKITTIPSTVSVLCGGSGAPEAFIVLKYPTDKAALNQAEISFIKKLLYLTEEAIDEHKQELQEYREVLWNNCDKENPDTEDAFRELNKVKNELKKLRTAKHKIQNIYTKIKAQSKGLM